jgi:hypothetical protein
MALRHQALAITRAGHRQVSFPITVRQLQAFLGLFNFYRCFILAAARRHVHRWEAARRDALLRKLLTDSSGNEAEEGFTRFAESGRWIAEMAGARNKECRKQEEEMEARTLSE